MRTPLESKVSVLLLAFTFGLPAQATEFCQPSTRDVPEFTFCDAKEAFDKSATPEESELFGRWKLIAYTYSRDFSSRRTDLGQGKYDEAGIRNENGKPVDSYHIRKTTSAVGQSVLTVKIENLRFNGEDFGPVASHILAGSMSYEFSIPLFEFDSKTGTYFPRFDQVQRFRCRTSAFSDDKLVCLSLRTDQSTHMYSVYERMQ